MSKIFTGWSVATDTDAVNEGIEMAGIANIFFWQVCKDVHHKVARISTVLHEWQPPGLDPNHVISNFAYAYLFKFLFVKCDL